MERTIIQCRSPGYVSQSLRYNLRYVKVLGATRYEIPSTEMLFLLSWNGQRNNMLGDPASLLSCLVLSVSLPGGGWSGKVTAAALALGGWLPIMAAPKLKQPCVAVL